MLLKAFNKRVRVATVNFSVPDAVKEAFNREFRNQNKSAVIAELMRRAVDESRARRRRKKAVRAILALRDTLEPASDEDIRRAREEARP